MAENPLLPNAELLKLLTQVQRCAELDAAAAKKAMRAKAKPPRVLPFREALLAGTATQLERGDLLLHEPGDATAATLMPSPPRGSAPAAPPLPQTTLESARLSVATAMAAALRAAGTDRVVLSHHRLGAQQNGWEDALGWAQEHLLPLILVCADPRGKEAFLPETRPPKLGAVGWSSVRRIAGRLKLPILTADGEDAVAVYRVMQESLLRARSGAGPAVIWAMLPSARELRVPRPRSGTPLGRMRQYLRTRNISF